MNSKSVLRLAYRYIEIVHNVFALQASSKGNTISTRDSAYSITTDGILFAKKNPHDEVRQLEKCQLVSTDQWRIQSEAKVTRFDSRNQIAGIKIRSISRLTAKRNT